MLSAVSAPVVGSLVVGGLLLGLGAVHEATLDEPVTRTLRLHAKAEKDFIYLSAWRDGDIQVTFPDDTLRGVTFRVRAHVSDGCHWQGTERIVPIDAFTFHYDYSEQILSCKPGATPARKTPRQGLVRIVD